MLFGAGGGISCLATTESNGGLVAYATKDTAPTVHIHDLDAPSAFVRSIPNVARARVSALAFSRDGKFLAIASAVPDLELRVIDPRTGDEIVTTSLPYDASALAFNPFNAYELIATHADAAGAASGDVPGVSVTIVDKVFETYLIRRVAIRSEDVGVNPTSLTGAAWSPSGNAYVGTSLGGVLIVDAKTGEVTSRSASAVDGGAGPTRAFAFTKEHVFVGGGGDGVLRVYPHFDDATASTRVKPTRTVPLPGGDGEDVVSVELSPLFDQAVVSTAECGLYLANITGAITSEETETAAAADVAGTGEDGGGDGDAPLTPVKEPEGGEEEEGAATAAAAAAAPAEASAPSPSPSPIEVVKIGDYHYGRATGVGAMSGGKVIVTCGVDGYVRGWDLATGGCAWKRAIGSAVTALANGSPDVCQCLAVASTGGVVRVFRCSHGSTPPSLILRVKLFEGQVDSMDMNGDGTIIAAAKGNELCFIEIVNPKMNSATAHVMGYVTIPYPAMSLSCSGSGQVIVSGEGGYITKIVPPPLGHKPGQIGAGFFMDDGSAAGVFVKGDIASVKIDTPLTAVESSLTAAGRVIGLGADGKIRTYELSSKASDWVGGKGKALEALSTIPMTKFGKQVITRQDKTVIGGADGRITVWKGWDCSGGRLFTRVVHGDTSTRTKIDGGCVDLARVPGELLASVGVDGSVAISAVKGLEGRFLHVDDDALGELHVDLVGDVAQDAPDDASEPTLVAAAVAASKGAAMHAGDGDEKIASAKAKMRAKVDDLKKRLEDTIARNAAADELERIPGDQLIVDAEFHARLVAEGDERVEEVRTTLMGENLRREYDAHRIKSECWDTMATHGCAILGFKAPGLVVRNYPLKKDDAATKTASKVSFLRKIEVMEERFLKDSGLDTRSTFDLKGTAEDAKTTAGANPGADADADADADAGEPSGEADGGDGGEEPTTPAARMSSSVDVAVAMKMKLPENHENMLYDPFKLYPPRRKITQMFLAQLAARESKSAFNAEFEEMLEVKQKSMDKLAELNTRIKEIRGELKSHTNDTAPLFEPAWTTEEQEGAALEVRDDEISAPKYLSPAEEAKRAKEAEEEAARARAKGANDPTVRALKDMMNGQLEAPDSDGMEELVKPEFYGVVAKEDWSEIQTKRAKEYELKAKALREELEKRRKTLDTELKKTREETEEVISKMDETLTEFNEKRNGVEGKLARLDSYVVACASEAERALTDDEVTKVTISETLENLAAQKVESAAVVAAFSKRVDECQKRYEEVVAEDNKLTRVFKSAFAETDLLFDTLWGLYRRRKAPARGVNANGTPGGSAAKKSLARASLRAAARRLSLAAHANHSPQRSPRSSINLKTPAKEFAHAGFHLAGGALAGRRGEGDHAAHKIVRDAQHDPFNAAFGGPVSSGKPKPRLPPVEPLDPTLDAVDGLDQAWWDRLVDHRDRKIAKEAELAAMRATLEEMQRYLFKITEEDAEVRSELDALQAEARAFARRRFDQLYDLAVPLVMKQGLVEAIIPELGGADGADGTRAARDDAVLIHRSTIERLNEVVHKRGASKLVTLEAIKEYKKGIYDLQWEDERLQMVDADLVVKIKELQLTRADRRLLDKILIGDGKTPKPKPEKPSKKTDTDGKKILSETASLEARLEQARVLHARLVSERKRELAKITRKMDEKRAQNLEISTQVVAMDDSVAEYVKVKEQRLTRAGESGGKDNKARAAEKKMRAMVTQRKLEDIATAQREDMMILREELDRARLRTYPSFVERRGDY